MRRAVQRNGRSAAANSASGVARAPKVDARRLPNHDCKALLAVSCSALLEPRAPALAGGDGMGSEDRISVDPEVRSGKPCIKGTRITVYDVLEYLAGGMTEEEILRDFPDLKKEDIRACLGFAAARERRLANPAA